MLLFAIFLFSNFFIVCVVALLQNFSVLLFIFTNNFLLLLKWRGLNLGLNVAAVLLCLFSNFMVLNASIVAGCINASTAIAVLIQGRKNNLYNVIANVVTRSWDIVICYCICSVIHGIIVNCLILVQCTGCIIIQITFCRFFITIFSLIFSLFHLLAGYFLACTLLNLRNLLWLLDLLRLLHLRDLISLVFVWRHHLKCILYHIPAANHLLLAIRIFIYVINLSRVGKG